MRHSLLVLLAAAGLATGATAQDRPREVSTDTVRREIRVTVDDEGGPPRIFTMGIQRRARLGIGVSLEPRATDTEGAYVLSVTPGGPAAKAGVKAGDLITRLGTSALVTSGAGRNREESAPGARLLELAAALEPGDTVKVEYLRDGARKTVALVTGDEPILGEAGGDAEAFVWRMPAGEDREFRMMPRLRGMPELPGMPDIMLDGRPGGPGRIEVERVGPSGAISLMRGPLADLELAPLNADLGSYFGTSEGVLVIKAPAGSSLGLKGGDVVLTVDGRKPAGPSSLIRILRSYEASETFRLEVLRQKKRETITASLGRSGRDE